MSDAARLEFDQLLEQLVGQAREVQESQSRLRGLLQAYRQVTQAVDLEEVLGHLVQAARDLVSARYAALGVVRDNQLVRFLHTGLDPATVAAIGDLPQGKGVLGQLVSDPQPMRLANIGDHQASVGFPANHPPMRSFLGVPVRVGDRVFGNLYLADKQDAAEFTSDDEELVTALAAVAGTAIENATLFDELRRRQSWQATMVSITTGLLAGGDPADALRELVRHTCQTLAAQGAGVNVPVDDGAMWRVAVTEGSFTRWQGLLIPPHGTITATAVQAGDLVVVPDPTTDERTTATAQEAVGQVGESLAVPLRGDRGITGVLVASRRPGEHGFDQIDREIIRAIAAHAGLALELAQVRQENEDLRLLEDRAQIAEDLRQKVIQPMFDLGLALQGAVARVGKPELREAIQEQVNAADRIIKDIRAAVFRLNPSPPADA
ncbi:hypothetical protein Rhe02_36340 [Rhizocola hellebori]|uniref:GAF domain-containing protein n=1 Tax=Rhizocola hellebori TaxID=1392758 RepID=A0A8J3Q918_9ACTN|nr:GAF domain-containing protein [Rhizocola hellebori]GIH05567.1 hypothetical protein Rhe02_36340 [Rhizocola hellebori]